MILNMLKTLGDKKENEFSRKSVEIDKPGIIYKVDN